MRTWFAALMAAFRFLTIFPFPGTIGTDSQDLARSTLFFPVVGLFLGLLAFVAGWLGTFFLPGPVAAVLLVLMLCSFSGGLHADGLADTADGFFSARPRKKILEILRDSRIGAMGVLALIMVLALKITSLAVLDRQSALRAVLLMPLLGRAAIVLTMAMLPYARQEGGLATLFYGRPVRPAALFALALACACCLALLGMYGLVLVMAWLVLIVLFARFCIKKIGGATGDTLGAVCELGETLVPLLLCLQAGNLA
jgi:adenosylcobinamide-GDP ribazoletransferase